MTRRPLSAATAAVAGTDAATRGGRRTGAGPRAKTSTGALAIATLLLLTACGGSDDDGGDDKIEASKPSSSPSASPTEAETPGRPEIKLPAGAKNVFENTETGDPKKDAVLADNAQRVDSIDDAIFQGKEETEALRLYSNGVALASASEFIRGWVEVGDTWVGVTRYFDREVTFRDDGAASVLYCADESKAFVKDGKTGEVDRSPATENAYVFYNTRLEKNADGVWQTVNVLSERGAEKCQP